MCVRMYNGKVILVSHIILRIVVGLASSLGHICDDHPETLCEASDIVHVTLTAISGARKSPGALGIRVSVN